MPVSPCLSGKIVVHFYKSAIKYFILFVKMEAWVLWIFQFLLPQSTEMSGSIKSNIKLCNVRKLASFGFLRFGNLYIVYMNSIRRLITKLKMDPLIYYHIHMVSTLDNFERSLCILQYSFCSTNFCLESPRQLPMITHFNIQTDSRTTCLVYCIYLSFQLKPS